jgi:hypothetical protein
VPPLTCLTACLSSLSLPPISLPSPVTSLFHSICIQFNPLVLFLSLSVTNLLLLSSHLLLPFSPLPFLTILHSLLLPFPSASSLSSHPFSLLVSSTLYSSLLSSPPLLYSPSLLSFTLFSPISNFLQPYLHGMITGSSLW